MFADENYYLNTVLELVPISHQFHVNAVTYAQLHVNVDNVLNLIQFLCQAIDSNFVCACKCLSLKLISIII